jgi:hypothetical protein
MKKMPLKFPLLEGGLKLFIVDKSLFENPCLENLLLDLYFQTF